MDAGKIFIREPGKQLRVLLSPVRRKIRKQQKEKSKNVFNSPAMEEYWRTFLPFFVDSQPKSLFYSSMDFIVENIDCVDSLIGIPETMGEQIFYRLLAYSITNRIIPSYRTLQIFVDAYKNKMADCLCLRDSVFAVNEYLDLFMIFLPYIRELDLSKCRLGDNHELIEKLGQLQCLESINLSTNALTDKTLRRMTLSYPNGPSKLRYLSLAYNPKITQRGLTKLSRFEELSVLDITGIKVDDVDELAEKLKMRVSDSGFELQIETKGWCDSFIRGMTKAVGLAIDEESQSRNSEQSRFYGKRRKICLNLFSDEVSASTTILKKSEIGSIVTTD